MSVFLVTGATGFIGRHLCQLLVERGHMVRGTLRKGPAPADFPTAIQWVEVDDIGPATDWSTALEDVDYVIHLAALAHQLGLRGEGRAANFMRVNADGTRHLAEEIARSATVKRLLFVSSVGAVRSQSPDTITASTPPRPDNDYARSKRAGELAVEEALSDTRADWCIIRPTLVYGPGNPGNMARLLKLINIGLPLPLGNINNRRSFVYVGNLVDALERCAMCLAASRRYFLVADDESVSTPELIRRLARHAGKPLRLVPVPIGALLGLGRLGNAMSRLIRRSIGVDNYSLGRLLSSLEVDTSCLREITGWRPRYTLDEGLAATIRHEAK